jgi:hypothetical protein
MARRRAGKANPRSAAPRAGGGRGAAKAAQPKAHAPSHAPSTEATASDRVAALERECERLRAELERERTRRRALEDVYAAARDRISWALDSLQGILDARR